ncbi:hypothetical protein SteCoe_16906 [Stentor coeruleus]|uniref:Nucleoplasmin-like domain-containing protein n=1 Tax=Stentor coeruleus TaxID=5963 RepID=A0A1R2C0B1_9CILI|nr:hypothetical protein SteCoe_16906 [Stentor coeruleus]
MFWGQAIEQGTTVNLSAFSNKGDIVHLSHINLQDTSSEGKTTVFITSEGKKFPLASLSKTMSQADFDLYLQTQSNVVFSVQGKGKAYLLGYFPPNHK